ncbi:hypothetical protein FB107DRAFT_271027 [Schizophyllum commune]
MAKPDVNALLPLVQPMVDLQCRSRAIHNKFRQLKGLLALTKLKSAEFRRDVETATQEDLGEDHSLPFFEPLDELADISSLMSSALQTLQASMHTHLVYSRGLDGLVYAGIVPLVQGRKFPLAFHRAEALLQDPTAADDVRAEVIAPVFAATKMCWEYKLKLERTAILIADV